MPKFIAVYFAGCTCPETRTGDDLDALVQWIKSGQANGKGHFDETDVAAIVDAETGEVLYEQTSAEGEWEPGDEGYIVTTWNGVSVYHAEDGGPNDRFAVEGVFSTMPCTDKDSEDTFTLDDLPEYKLPPKKRTAAEEIIHTLRAAIESGDLTEDGLRRG